MTRTFPGVTLHLGDCLEVLPTIEAGSVDAVVTDPPYGLSFMGKSWDHGVPGVEFWRAVLTVAKPGSFLAAFGGTRTYHRLAVAIEDAGWEIRDTLCWHYGTGFPKSKSCMKPGWEPIVLAKSPGKLRELGIDECRIGTDMVKSRITDLKPCHGNKLAAGIGIGSRPTLEVRESLGRWPANVLLTHSPDCNGTCVDGCPVRILGEQSGERDARPAKVLNRVQSIGFGGTKTTQIGLPGSVNDTGTAARFFYTTKASRSERGEDNTHPTVKPIAIMEWVTKLVCPPGGRVLDPFIGSGTTALAAINTGHQCVGIERDNGYFDIACRRVTEALDKTALLNPIVS